jgi:hypothetical protein
MVAFHFQFANQAGWMCDLCRKSGLERQRRCGWLPDVADTRRAPVWARKQVAIDACPKTYITVESQLLLEEFFVRRRLGGVDCAELSARQAEAFVILERALEEERNDEQRYTRTTA